MTEETPKIDARGASAYFATRTTRASQWGRYSKAQQEAAVTEAAGLFTAEFGPPDDTRQTERECVFEQSLYLLARNAIPTVFGSERPALNGPQTNAEISMADFPNAGPWSLNALAKLGTVTARVRNIMG